MNVKRIITSLGMLAFAGAVVVGGTGAFFTDTETSTGNVFTAGSVTIGFGGIEHTYAYGNGDDPVPGYFTTGTANNIPFFTFTDLKPRDAGTLDFDFDNGANEAFVCGFIGGEAPDTNPDLALWQNLNFYEANGGDQVLPGTWFDLGTIDPDTTDTFEVDYCFGDWDGTSCDVDPGVDYNEAQNGTFGADLTLFAIQTRNNDGFSCDQLTFEGGEPVYTPIELPAVGATLGAYTAPDSCDVTVGPSGEYDSIQDAIDTEGSDTIICVADDYDEAGFDNSPIRINQDNITLAALTQGTAIGEPVVIDNDGATVTGFTGSTGAVLGSNAAFYVNNGVDGYAVTFNQVDGGTNGVETSIAGTSNGLVANNVFSNLTRGIYYNLSTNIVTELNTFENNTVGIANSSPEGNVIRFNNFTGNSEAIGYDESLATGNEDLSINQNNFDDGEVNNYSSGTVDATNNWWGGDGSADNLNIPAPASGPITTAPEQVSAFPIN